MEYEIIQINEHKEEIVKCYRRYDNFDKLNFILRKRYPYSIIPKLTGKHTLTNILNSDEEFYDNRRRQLNYYILYLSNHEFLKNTKEFLSFINEAVFDEGYFHLDELMGNFPYCGKITETMKNKILGVFSNLFGYKEEVRKTSEEEILLKRMEIHYKGIYKKYKEMKNNISNYLKTIKSNCLEFKDFSKICFYLKDAFENNEKTCFKNVHNLSNELFCTNKRIYYKKVIILENKFEVLYYETGININNIRYL